MKQKLTIIGSALCLMFIINTQSMAQMKFGVIGGFNFNDLTGSDVNSDGMSVGYHLGAFVNFGEQLMIEPQLLYSVKGTKGASDNLNLSYVEIPIWIRYQLENGFNINAGPYAGILVGAKVDGNDFKDSYKSTDFGLGFGIGYQMSSGLGFAANYSMGLTSIGEEYEIFGTKYDIEARTTCIKLSASYTFGGRRE